MPVAVRGPGIPAFLVPVFPVRLPLCSGKIPGARVDPLHAAALLARIPFLSVSPGISLGSRSALGSIPYLKVPLRTVRQAHGPDICPAVLRGDSRLLNERDAAAFP